MEGFFYFILFISLLIIAFTIGKIGTWLIPSTEANFDKECLKNIRANFELFWAAKLERENNLKQVYISDKQLKIIRANFEREWAAKLERENN